MAWLPGVEAVQARSISVLFTAVAVRLPGAVGGCTGMLRNAAACMTQMSEAVAVPR